MKTQGIKSIYLLSTVIFSFAVAQVKAQQPLKVGSNFMQVSPSAIFEVEAANKGILIPRIALTSLLDVTTVPTPDNSLLVFNTNTTSDLSQGYYYYSDSDKKWIRLLTSVAQADVRVVGDANHISQDAGVGGNGTSVGTGSGNIAIGLKALNSNTNGVDNVALGQQALKSNTSGYLNMAIGANALNANTDGAFNVALGGIALSSNTSGKGNVAVGTSALSVSTASNNTALGNSTLVKNTTGAANVGLGAESLLNNTTGNNNLALGYQSGKNITTGSNNLAIGNAVDLQSATADNQMNIKNTIFGTGMNGSLASPAGAIGINQSAPTNTLHVTATSNPLRLDGLTAGATSDKLLVADVNGVVKTVTTGAINSSEWHITGNAGTSASSNFLGTTDAQPLVVRTNNIERIRLSSSGDLGIGTTSPLSRLDVQTASGKNDVARFITAGNTTSTMAELWIGNNSGTWTSLAAGNNLFQVRNLTTSAVSLHVDLANDRVGIGSTSPTSKLEVNGAVTNTTAFNAGLSTTIDFSKSNLAYTTANPGSFNLTGMKDGGTYTLAVQGQTAGTAVFSGSNPASTALTFKSPNNSLTINGTDTVYTFLVMGTTVYFYMTPGI
ncbi:beta strand repeat-containing protein [Nubsella zeaxanthinifaciens]|uniref:beta strand repeat-containing protein n=1 Tax=Nubsella zeaxanthinifaciens TaxID=392412 RepID=UPI000DE52960|nr:hypothetical protein [Nubsella zeaxanthinifaciens]